MVKRLLTQVEFREIEELAKEAIAVSRKRDGAELLQRLEFLHDTMSSNIQSNVRYMLGELASYTEGATGQVREKEHWVGMVRQALYKLEMYGVEKETNHE